MREAFDRSIGEAVGFIDVRYWRLRGRGLAGSLLRVTTDDEREELAQDLLRLSLPELVDVLRRVLPAHGQGDDPSGPTLVLANVFRLSDGDSNLPEPLVEVVAWPDRDYYDGGFGPEPALYEQGSCRSCHVEVTSTAKRAFCPLCGALCELT
jgi:hypothetical protein